jgi:hypothetical protein
MIRLFTLVALLSSTCPCLAQAVRQPSVPDSIRAQSPRYSLFRPVPRARLRPMSTDRPDATESAYSVDAGHFQVETDLVRLGQQRFDGEANQQQLALNHANLKLGLTRQMDLQVVVESYTIQTEDAEQPVRRAGFGDVTLRLKRNLWGNDDGPTALALMPFVKLPTGRSCGNRAWEGGIVAPFAWQLPRDWSFGSQLQASWNRDPEAQEHYLEMAPTVTVGHDLYRTLGGFVEVAGAWDTRAPAWTATLNGGPVWRVTDNLQLDLGVNLALTRATETSYFLGCSFRR